MRWFCNWVKPGAIVATVTLAMGSGTADAQPQYGYPAYAPPSSAAGNYSTAPATAPTAPTNGAAAHYGTGYNGSGYNAANYNAGAYNNAGVYNNAGAYRAAPYRTANHAPSAPVMNVPAPSALAPVASGALNYSQSGECCGTGNYAAYNGCDPCDPCTVGAQSIWRVDVGALFLSVIDQDHFNFSYDSANESLQYTDAKNADINYATGIEARIIRQEACSCAGTELVYWGLFSADASTSTLGTAVAGNLNGIHNWDQLDYNGNTADTYVDNASIHRLRRNVEVHNIEWNRFSWFSDCGCNDLEVQFLGGFRYFRFTDNLQFASDPNDTAFTGEVDEIYYDMDAENNLIGLQLGTLARYRVSSKWLLTMGIKAGVYDNHASAYSRIYGSAGTATINNGPNNGQAFLVNANKDSLSMLGELELGAAYQINPRWRASFGYRVVGVSGVVTPTNQVFADLRGLQDVRLLSNNGSLILHGLRTSLEARF